MRDQFVIFGWVIQELVNFNPGLSKFSSSSNSLSSYKKLLIAVIIITVLCTFLYYLTLYFYCK